MMAVIEMSGKRSFMPESNWHPVKKGQQVEQRWSVNIGSLLNHHVASWATQTEERTDHVETNASYHKRESLARMKGREELGYFPILNHRWCLSEHYDI